MRVYAPFILLMFGLMAASYIFGLISAPYLTMAPLAF